MQTDMEKCIKTMFTNICLNSRWVFALTVFKLLLFANCKYLQKQVFACKDVWGNTIFSVDTYLYEKKGIHIWTYVFVIWCLLFSTFLFTVTLPEAETIPCDGDD